MRGCTLRVAVPFLLASAAWGAAAPYYTAQSIVNAADYSPGPFAPNSIVALFGTDLMLTTGGIPGSSGGVLPIEMNGVQVWIDFVPASLLYVSPTQINFVVPPNESAGKSTLMVVRQTVPGPAVTITIADAAPALFPTTAGLAIATHLDGSVITADQPARPNEIVVLYLCGLGQTRPVQVSGTLAPNAAQIAQLANLKILLDGTAVDPSRVLYAGITPGFAGLYQINFALPGQVGNDPEIRVAVGGAVSSAGIKLAVRQP